MPSGAMMLVGLNAIVAAALVVAAAGKLAAPASLARALRELDARLIVRTADRGVRVLALAELAVAVALLVPPVRIAGAVGAGVLGTGFAAAGAVGWARGSRLPCGCFGRAGHRPLGPANLALGVVVIAVLPADTLLDPARASTADAAAAGALASATAAIVLSVLLHRDLVRALLRRADRTQAAVH